MLGTHLTAHTGFQKITQAHAQYLWHRLHRHFGTRIMALTLMPDHVHLILEGVRKADLELFRSVLTSAKPRLKFSIPEGVEIPNQKHLARQVRYVHLNPCREGLCADPLEWLWSTHRDYLGAGMWEAAEVDRRLLILGYEVGRRGREAFHTYVSGDPSVDPRGTRPPPHFDQPLLLDLSRVTHVAAQVLRVPPQSFLTQRKLNHRLIRALRRAPNLQGKQIATALGVHPSTVSRCKHRPADDALLKAVVMTLAEPRLTATRFAVRPRGSPPPEA